MAKVDIKATILKRIDEVGWNGDRAAIALFLDHTEIQTLSYLLETLSLEITPAPKSKAAKSSQWMKKIE